jgi:hypothetical protein
MALAYGTTADCEHIATVRYVHTYESLVMLCTVAGADLAPTHQHLHRTPHRSDHENFASSQIPRPQAKTVYKLPSKPAAQESNACLVRLHRAAETYPGGAFRQREATNKPCHCYSRTWRRRSGLAWNSNDLSWNQAHPAPAVRPLCRMNGMLRPRRLDSNHRSPLRHCRYCAPQST